MSACTSMMKLRNYVPFYGLLKMELKKMGESFSTRQGSEGEGKGLGEL